MPVPDPTADLETLIRRLCDDGHLSQEEVKRLNDLLRGDVDACEGYLNHLMIEAQLTRDAAPSPVITVPFTSNPQKPVQRSQRPISSGWIAAAAAVTLSVGFWVLDRSKEDAAPIATVLFSENTEWKGFAPEEGQALNPGTLRLRKGVAVIRFQGGAELALSGMADVNLLNSGSAKLLHGRAFVRAADGANGFCLQTPACELADLGAEFSAQANKKTGTHVHVLEGEVAARPAQSDHPNEIILQQGEAMAFRNGSASGKAVAFDATEFTDVIRKAQPRERRDLMLAYDGFHYDAGRYQPEEISRGKGWAGPWRLRTEAERFHGYQDETTDMHIVHGKLNVVWPVEGGRLGMLEMPAGKNYRIRPMKEGLQMGEDGVTFFSLMVHQPGRVPNPASRSPREGVRLTFRNSANYTGDHLSFGITNRLHPQIQTRLGSNDVSPAKAPSKQTTLWIGKIVSRKHGEDQISFRIYGEDDALDYAEPATWHVASRGIRQDQRLDLLVLSSEGQSPRVFDEFRLGPTWRSVVPIQILITGL